MRRARSLWRPTCDGLQASDELGQPGARLPLKDLKCQGACFHLHQAVFPFGSKHRIGQLRRVGLDERDQGLASWRGKTCFFSVAR